MIACVHMYLLVTTAHTCDHKHRGLCLFSRLLKHDHDCMCPCVPFGDHCTHMRPQAKRMPQRPDFEALVLLCCCCTAAVLAACTVATRLLLKSRGSVALYRHAPTSQHPINCTSREIMWLCARSYFLRRRETWHKQAHAQMHRPWPPQRRRT